MGSEMCIRDRYKYLSSERHCPNTSPLPSLLRRNCGKSQILRGIDQRSGYETVLYRRPTINLTATSSKCKRRAETKSGYVQLILSIPWRLRAGEYGRYTIGPPSLSSKFNSVNHELHRINLPLNETKLCGVQAFVACHFPIRISMP